MDFDGSAEYTPPQAELEKTEKPQVDNLQDLFTGFKLSPRYAESMAKFYEGKQLADDVTEEEKIEVFDSIGEGAKFAFLDYVEHDVNFESNPELLPPDAAWEINNYREVVKAFDHYVTNGRGSVEDNQEELLEKDRKRSRVHTRAGKTLYDLGLAPSQRLGKAAVSVMIGKLHEARQSDVDRIANALKNR